MMNREHTVIESDCLIELMVLEMCDRLVGLPRF